MKKVFYALFVISLIWLSTGCSSVPAPRKVYDGADRPKEQLSRFYMVGKGSFKAVLYKVDGKTCSDLDGLKQTYLGFWHGFNLMLLPGHHDFEFVIIKDEYAETVSFVMEAGSDYEFVKEKEDYLVFKKTADGNKVVDVKRNRLSFYKEPDKSAPHGVVIQDEETFKESGFAIYRIDGMPGTATEFLDNSNLFVGLGYYELRLTPGKHIIEFTGGLTGKGDKYYLFKVCSKQIIIEAGKKYRMRFVNIENVEKGVALGEIELVSIK